MKIVRVLIFSTVCVLGITSSIAAAEQRAKPTFLDFVVLWLNSQYQLEVPASHPDIIAMPLAELVARRYGPGASATPGDVVALYDKEAHAILVSDDWTGGSLAQLSVLVHEMVHHSQDVSGTIFACPAEREKLAYRAQNEWLKLFDEDLEGAFGIDPALILVATACVH
ncbi:DUF6647 family protein [Granulosicoccus antarcticus]|uniref:DUF6647 domain-containing protein n=1 Tax=Granulosicoccus antarcticus IMCC3135 TaxID=1192854 RepID=A0A2Z2P7G5_9GAMM|nr:DUF6647 family protein [Granulosicoccus antarcticus]ASJ75784.1 hypothetical protein IMCC3135_28660 [Granulosicoccus antarcticus IMCC3135]